MRGLTDHPPRSLPPAGARLWEQLYVASEGLYDHEWSSHVADKVTSDLWTSAGRPRQRRYRPVLPDPGNAIMLGFALDVHYLCPHGRIAIRRFTRTPVSLRNAAKHRRLTCPRCSSWRPPGRYGAPCLWSPRLQAVLVFPSMPIPRATMPGTSLPRLLKVYRKFHAGREPKDGASPVVFPDVHFNFSGPAIAEGYTSDKFDDEGEYVDYIHHNHKGARKTPGPMVFISDDCTMVRGGRLALTAAGLVY